jgi:hypothetical protein
MSFKAKFCKRSDKRIGLFFHIIAYKYILHFLSGYYKFRLFFTGWQGSAARKAGFYA